MQGRRHHPPITSDQGVGHGSTTTSHVPHRTQRLRSQKVIAQPDVHVRPVPNLMQETVNEDSLAHPSLAPDKHNLPTDVLDIGEQRVQLGKLRVAFQHPATPETHSSPRAHRRARGSGQVQDLAWAGTVSSQYLWMFRLSDDDVTGLPLGPREPTRQHPLGLTPRQAEVLDLISDGRLNAEIADQLFLFVRTVENHVSAVLLRSGVKSAGGCGGGGQRDTVTAPSACHPGRCHDGRLPQPRRPAGAAAAVVVSRRS